jgi:hypothetical protein
MGYDVHVTRANDWFDSETHPITADEWLGYVRADPELAIDPRDNGPHFALWLAHRVGDDHAWFDWSEGRISTKNPDPATLRKAVQIARHFGARVLGDDGEEYGPEDLAGDGTG